jgi:excisionase family DNA binding protein
MYTSTPSQDQQALALSSSHALTAALESAQPQQYILTIQKGDQEETAEVELPEKAVALLAEILDLMARGNAATLIPVHAEMTTQEAADFLHVSRPFLVGILETGQIPFRKVGTRRRVRFQDVLTYKQSIDAQREQALDALTAQAQELGMGY